MERKGFPWGKLAPKATDEGKTMLPYNKKLKDYSRQLRKSATKEECRLWYNFLKTYTVQFNRQKVIGNFIVDFYCDKAKLVIELDGAQHYEENAQIYDEERTAYLRSLGIEVFRVTNIDINNHFSEVCLVIDEKVNERVDPHQSASQTASPGGSL